MFPDFSGQRQKHATRTELNERNQERVGWLEVLGAHARPDPRPAAPCTYQARPRLVARDSRLSPVRGSAQPACPRASGFFLPSLRFSDSGAATLGPGFFRLFTSDMSGTLKISKARMALEGGPWDVAAAPLRKATPPQGSAPAPKRLAPPSDSSTRLESAGNSNSRVRAGCREERGGGGAESATSSWARARGLAPPHCACEGAQSGLADARRAGRARARARARARQRAQGE